MTINLLEYDDVLEIYQLADEYAYHDAWYFQGIPVSETDPTAGQVLAYNAVSEEYEPVTPSSGPALTDAAPANVTKETAAVGTATTSARADHKHDVATAAPGTSGVASLSDEGTATTLARSDHKHYAYTTPSNVTKSTALVGLSGQPARGDHKHDVTTAAPSATGVATASAEGTATSLARSDHAHQSATAPANVTKATAAIGTSGEPARADHKHDVTTAAPGALASGDTVSEGTATSLARSDHKHGPPLQEVVTLTNGTGSASVLGQVVMIDPANDFSYVAAEMDTIFACGVVLDAGIANGSPVRICTHGHCQMLFPIGNSTTRGYWASMSQSEDGMGGSLYVETGNVFSQGLGMIEESVAESETNPILAWVIFDASKHRDIPVGRMDS